MKKYINTHNYKSRRKIRNIYMLKIGQLQFNSADDYEGDGTSN